MMRILALVPYPFDTAPGQRYRIEQWAPILEELGAEITFVPFRGAELNLLLSREGNTLRKIYLTARESARRLKVLKLIKDYDLVYIYKEAALLGPALIERCISMKGVPFVFDLDDAIFVHSPSTSPVNRCFRSLKFPGKTGTICRLAAHVIAGNSYLASYSSRFNQHVTVVPTTIDTVKYVLEQPKVISDPPVIGWTGSYTTVHHLNTVRRALMRLAEKERFRVRVIGTDSYQIAGVEVEVMPWRPETETADLRAIDIGIMPLPDDEWARGKCGCKALQYMALGIPTICSPVGVNTKIIQDDENGLLATTEDQWIEKLTRLLHSPSLRARLGKAGRATVEAEYSMSMHAPRIHQIFESVLRPARIKEHSSRLPKNSEASPVAPLMEAAPETVTEAPGITRNANL
jgi:glycosyltransferase involved in cell wall biosynthesis